MRENQRQPKAATNPAIVLVTRTEENITRSKKGSSTGRKARKKRQVGRAWRGDKGLWGQTQRQTLKG